MTINLKEKGKIIKKFGNDVKNSGTTEVQVALLTEKIKQLTEHLKENHKDSASKRGLLMMVGKRKRLLAYLKKRNIEGYRELIKKLGIRG